MRRKSVFVVGLNHSVRRHLERMPLVQESCDVRGVLDRFDSPGAFDDSLESLLAQSVEQIDAMGTPVDAILGFGEFPVAALVSLLCEHYGVPGTPLETIAACVHGGWARALELRASPSHVLPFRIIDPFAQVELEAVGLELPFSIRPVFGRASALGVRVSRRDELEPCLARLRSAISTLAPPFEDLIDRVSLPAGLATIGARHCIVEPALGGCRCRVEAYAFEGRVHSYGITDCGPHPATSGVVRRQYPSNLPFPIQDEIRGLVGEVGRALGFEYATFTVELVDEVLSDRRWLLDVAPGPAAQDVPLFQMVDGSSGCAVAVELALGRPPTYVHGRGRFGCAASVSSPSRRPAEASQPEDGPRGDPGSITVGGSDTDELLEHMVTARDSSNADGHDHGIVTGTRR